ncbi:MAG: DUF6338 family protein [Deltaproteobacteria bacterium]|nr:DUF6338 family protein [Deltaproteobacteria bacterium]
MNWPSSEIVGVLSFLLPGFVAAAVFYSLTSYPKPGPFDRVVQALIFTVIGKTVTEGLFFVGSIGADDPWRGNWELLVSVMVAVVLGLLTAYCINWDTLHRLLRRLGLTRETSYASEWYSAFSRHCDCYVILHLKGERRLYGWPEEWPSRPDEGHFRIAEAEWLDAKERIPATGVSAILIPAEQVEIVEFLRESQEEPEELNNGQGA